MKVKIGDTWFDAKDEPICIELNDQDKEVLANIGELHKKYAVFPEDWGSKQEMLDWMAQ